MCLIFSSFAYGQEIIISRNRGGIKEKVVFKLKKRSFDVEMNSNFLMKKSNQAKIGKFSGKLSSSKDKSLRFLLQLAKEPRNQMTKEELKSRSHSTKVFVNKIPIYGFIRLDRVILKKIKNYLNNNISEDSNSKTYRFNKETNQALYKNEKYKCKATLNESFSCYISKPGRVIYFK